MISSGRGQKLCRLLNVTSPASYIFWMPGMSEMRMPCPSSMWLNPSSCLISRSISSPATWRPEFQQVEKEIIPRGSMHRDGGGGGLGWRNRFDSDRLDVPSGHPHHQQGAAAETKRRNHQRSPHTDEIGEPCGEKTRDRHQPEEAQSENGGDSTA